MKTIRSINVDDKVYKDFQMYAIILNTSVSALLEKYMKNVVKKINKKN